jgi:hypothetical protein
VAVGIVTTLSGLVLLIWGAPIIAEGPLLAIFVLLASAALMWAQITTPRADRPSIETPETTGTEESVPPDIEKALNGAHSLTRADDSEIDRHREAVVSGLRTAAIELLSQRGVPKSIARDKVRRGSWTTNEKAAELLDETTPIGVTWGDRLWSIWTGDCPFHSQVGTAIEEVESVSTTDSGSRDQAGAELLTGGDHE